MLSELYAQVLADVVAVLNAGVCVKDGEPIRIPGSMIDYQQLATVVELRINDLYNGESV